MRLSDAQYKQLEKRMGKPAKPARLPVCSEHDEQVAVIQWAIANIGRRPELEWLFAIPNGGHRDIATAVSLQAEGVQPGVPDLFLPVPTHQWHGLWIEMKRADHSNGPSHQQTYWLEGLRRNGYMAVVCYGADEAIRVLEHYLSHVG